MPWIRLRMCLEGLVSVCPSLFQSFGWNESVTQSQNSRVDAVARQSGQPDEERPLLSEDDPSGNDADEEAPPPRDDEQQQRQQQQREQQEREEQQEQQQRAQQQEQQQRAQQQRDADDEGRRLAEQIAQGLIEEMTREMIQEEINKAVKEAREKHLREKMPALYCNGHGTFAPGDGTFIVPPGVRIQFCVQHGESASGTIPQAARVVHTAEPGTRCNNYRLWPLYGPCTYEFPLSQAIRIGTDPLSDAPRIADQRQKTELDNDNDRKQESYERQMRNPKVRNKPDPPILRKKHELANNVPAIVVTDGLGIELAYLVSALKASGAENITIKWLACREVQDPYHPTGFTNPNDQGISEELAELPQPPCATEPNKPTSKQPADTGGDDEKKQTLMDLPIDTGRRQQDQRTEVEIYCDWKRFVRSNGSSESPDTIRGLKMSVLEENARVERVQAEGQVKLDGLEGDAAAAKVREILATKFFHRTLAALLAMHPDARNTALDAMVMQILDEPPPPPPEGTS